jgi:hypothetical protein
LIEESHFLAVGGLVKAPVRPDPYQRFQKKTKKRSKDKI